MYNILIDTGFWIALLDPASNPNLAERANNILIDITNERIIIPFPTFYEFVNSKLSREKNKVGRDEFERILGLKNIDKISDSKYKEEALKNFFTQANYSFTDVSLVDEIIKLIIIGGEYKFDYIASFDQGLVNFAISKGIREI